MIGFYNYTVIATFIGTLSGIFGIVFAFSGQPLLAMCSLMLCGSIDMFDGKIAKTRVRTDAEKRFGIQIDSLSDMICFGVLPPCVGYAIGMRHWLCALPMAVYTIAGLIRLAYFNVTEEERQSTTDGHRKFYEGLPITCSAFVFPAVYVLCCYLPAAVAPWVYGVALLACAATFVGKFRLPKPGLKGMLVMLAIGVLEFALLVFLGR